MNHQQQQPPQQGHSSSGFMDFTHEGFHDQQMLFESNDNYEYATHNHYHQGQPQDYLQQQQQDCMDYGVINQMDPNLSCFSPTQMDQTRMLYEGFQMNRNAGEVIFKSQM